MIEMYVKPPTRDEIRNNNKKKTTTRHTKNWKAAGVDNIAELLKADIDTAVNKIHKTINKVRREGSILQDWTNGG